MRWRQTAIWNPRSAWAGAMRNRAASRAAPPCGPFRDGGQEHFYLEGQIAQAVPGEDGRCISSLPPSPSEVQHLVAHLLGVPSADVTVETRRLGGGFGGKETQATAPAAACAMVARLTGRPARMRYDRDDDMAITGKRHDFVAITMWALTGRADRRAAARSGGALRAFGRSFRLDQRSRDVSCRQHLLAAGGGDPEPPPAHHTVSNTAFRGFGGPQGMIAIERVIDAIAADLGRDPLEVRRANLYAPGRDITPYGMKVADNIAPELIEALAQSCDYTARRKAVAAFNAAHSVLKKGIALTPVKFGISFTATHLNQAGALVLVYADGSIQLNHGGIEMGQGLIKVAQVVADVFAVPLSRIRITATRTDKVPNTSATAASSGSDLNGMAAFNAARDPREAGRLLAEKQGVEQGEVRFTPEGVVAGDAILPFAAVARQAYMARCNWASGFYATPKIHYDRAAHQGHPSIISPMARPAARW
jgi:xanthine dehydrogenase large subunit